MQEALWIICFIMEELWFRYQHHVTVVSTYVITILHVSAFMSAAAIKGLSCFIVLVRDRHDRISCLSSGVFLRLMYRPVHPGYEPFCFLSFCLS